MSKNAEIINVKPEFAGDVILIEQIATPSPPTGNSGQPIGLLLALTQS